MIRKGWHIKEEEFLIENYLDMTIKELQTNLKKLSGYVRSADSINAKVGRLKLANKIDGSKDPTAVDRALRQRRRDVDE